jgi:hypothetical protein
MFCIMKLHKKSDIFLIVARINILSGLVFDVMQMALKVGPLQSERLKHGNNQFQSCEKVKVRDFLIKPNCSVFVVVSVYVVY